MAANVTFNGRVYDLSSVAQAMEHANATSAFITDMANTVNVLRTQMNQPPVQPQPQQQQLVAALQTAFQSPPFQIPRNEALSTPGNDVLHEDHPPAAGFKDVKVSPPAPFNGRPGDAKPFLQRFEAYIHMRANALRLTKTRIIVIANLMQEHPPTREWVTAVTTAITGNQGTSPFYFDNWDNFKAAFIKQFGITDEGDHYQNLLFKMQQGNTQWETFFIHFEKVRNEAKFSKDQAFFFLKRATNKQLLKDIMSVHPSPKTYDAFCEIALAKTQDARANSRLMSTLNPASVSRFGQQSSRPAADHTLVSQGGNMMDVDAIKHKKKGKGKPQSKPQPKPNPRPSQAPHPAAAAYRIPTGNSGFSRPPVPRGVCFRCRQPGHMAINCRTPIKEISHDHVNFLMEVGVRSYEEPTIPIGEDQEVQEEDQEEEEDNDEDDFITTSINQVQAPLIDFGSEEQNADNQDF